MTVVRIFLFLSLLSPSLLMARVDFQVDADFSIFYKEFRESILSDDSAVTVKNVCFPFVAHEVGELVDKKYPIKKDKFIALRLDKELLADSVWEFGSVVDGKMTINTPYDSQRDFIIDTADIHYSERLGPSFFNYVSSNKKSGKIFNLEFKKIGPRWCWSGATFNWDIPGLNIKH